MTALDPHGNPYSTGLVLTAQPITEIESLLWEIHLSAIRTSIKASSDAS